MIRRPPRSTLFPTRRSSDLLLAIPLLDYLGGIGSLLMVCVLLAAAGAFLARRANDSRRLVLGGVPAGLLLGLLGFQTPPNPVELPTVKLSVPESAPSVFDVHCK